MNTKLGTVVLYMMDLLELPPLGPFHASTEFEARSELSSEPHLLTI